jgi:Uma2 family endonuclease
MGNPQPNPYFTPEEYFALERASDKRWEYWDGEVVCMSGGTLNHGLISGNLFNAIQNSLKSGKCRAFTGDMAVKSPALEYYRYPDVSVVCGKAETERIDVGDAITNPIVIIEVLSSTTEQRDRNEKRKLYQAIPTLHEYLLVDQYAANIVRYVRQGNIWQQDGAVGREASIELSSIGVVLSLEDVYNGVEFD